MFSSLLFLAEGGTFDDLTFDEGGDPVSDFNDSFQRAEDTFNIIWVVFPIIFVAVLGLIIFVAVRNYRAAKRHGMDPFAVETELAGRVYNSGLLAPTTGQAQSTRTKAERLDEIEGMYRSGSINAEERQRARDAILAED